MSICRYVLSLGFLCFLLASCGGTRFSTDISDYAEEVEALQRRLLERPDDAEALAELGVIYVRTAQYGQGLDYLQRAFSEMPRDPRVLYHLGVASEALNKPDTAIRLYGKYVDVPRLSPYRSLMEGRYQLLNRALVREEMKRLVEVEATRGDAPTSPRIVAVFPLVYQGEDQRYLPLGRGLSEMLSVDLANVRSLTLVERVRLQALLDELELGQTGYVDPASAPRVGRLLGAGRIVGGSYNVLGGDKLRLDPDVISVGESGTLALEGRSGDLARLFEIEKEIVFSLVEEMGIELSPEERDEIEQVPTRNLQAFLAYSRGLMEQDAGDYAGAAAQFEAAAQLDPNFSQAAQEAEASQSLSSAAASPTPEAAVRATSSLAAPTPSSVNPLDSRVVNLNSTIGAAVMPGSKDSRESAAEAAESSGDTIDPLPAPPAPPARGN